MKLNITIGKTTRETMIVMMVTSVFMSTQT